LAVFDAPFFNLSEKVASVCAVIIKKPTEWSV
jgi:hypothetical protein